MLITYIIIFLLAATPFFEIAAIIPIAIIGGVPAIPTMIIAFLGNMVTIVLLIVFVDKIKSWREKRVQKKKEKKVREQITATTEVEDVTERQTQGAEEVTEAVDIADDKDEKKHRRARNIWDKYGMPGLVFVGPFLVGSHLSVFLAVAFGGTRERTLVLMTFSLIIWSIIFGVAAYFGFDYFIADDEDLGFITRLLRLDK